MSKLHTLVLTLIVLVMMTACSLQSRNPTMEQLSVQLPSGSETATIPPTTPLASLTPSQTLKPPPTFEPPTQTRAATLTPTVTLTPTLQLDVSIPGLNGAESPTPSTTPGCEPREDWGLTYTVQANDALARIAQTYGTYVDALVEGNCLTNRDLIRVGQVLRVPGESQSYVPDVACVPFELLTPANGTLNVEGDGVLTFNWRGPRAPRNLIRVHKPDGSTFELVLELRQNETIDLYESLPASGTYTWYVYPLDAGFVQVCPEGGPWTFTKGQAPTATLTPTEMGEQQAAQPTQPARTIIVTATPTPEVPTEPPAEGTDEVGEGG